MTAPPLSGQLRAGTASAHADAEGSPFLTAVVEGRVPVTGLVALLQRLLVVYGALEQVGAGFADDPVVAPFLLPGLERTARLQADLTHLGAAPAPASPAAQAHAARLRASAGSPARYLAHHYVRCLGDLSGGQVLRAALARHLGLADGAGLSFLSFPDLQPGAAKQRYRALLDALPLDDGGRALLLAEALVAYRMSSALVAELDADPACWAP